MLTEEQIDLITSTVVETARREIAAHPPRDRDGFLSIRGHEALRELAEAMNDGPSRTRIVLELARALRPLAEEHEIEHLHVGHWGADAGHVCLLREDLLRVR